MLYSKTIIEANEISKSDCQKIAIKIREIVFKPAYRSKTTIFLCGADISLETTIRYKIREVLTNFWYSFDYDLIYPEDIFEELLYSSKSKDLLSLENLLAESVDAVVIIPESPGSFAELGAFANNEQLRSKIICVIDNKYRKNKSFINQGPIKLIKNVNRDHVVYIDKNEIGKPSMNYSYIFSNLSKDKEVEKITSALKKMKRASPILGEKITLLQLEKYLLPVIYLLEPVSKLTLINTCWRS